MTNELSQPIVFQPYYKSVIWGGDAIGALKGVDTHTPNTGESWEISAVPGHESVVAEGPLAGRNICELMAHYGADFTGKTEMWYVVDAKPGSHIYSGLQAPLTREEYPACAADGTIMQRIGAHEAEPGQFYFIPAGTLHAIGAGTLIAEVQQTSDITYRVYDYGRLDTDGRPRQLHTELAADAIDYRFPNPVEPTAKRFDKTTEEAVSCRYFNVDYIAGGECKAAGNPDSFTILMAVGGPAEVTGPDEHTLHMHRGTTAMLAAAAPEHTVKAEGALLKITIK